MRDKNNIVKSLKVSVLSVLFTCFASLSAMAITETSTLSSIEIKDSDNGYQVILKADKFSEVRKVSESRDDLVLDVKGMLPLESVGTVYNNVPDIDSVMIQPDNGENTKIMIHGKNISSANVYFAPLESVDAKKDSEAASSAIELSRPMQTYAPVFKQETQYEDIQPNGMLETAASLALGSAESAKPYASKLYRYVKKLDKKFLLLGGIFSLIILFGLKSVKPEKNNEIKIGLSQSLKEKELAMRDELSLAGSAQTLRSQGLPAGKNVPSINYGIKAYQNSQRNPYTSQISGLPMKNVYNNQAKRPVPLPTTRPMPQAVKKPTPMMNQSQTVQSKPMTAPSGLAANRPAGIPSVQGRNIDSMKFLESMTKIYERSGRADLANELKSSMQKVQIPN